MAKDKKCKVSMDTVVYRRVFIFMEEKLQYDFPVPANWSPRTFIREEQNELKERGITRIIVRDILFKSVF